MFHPVGLPHTIVICCCQVCTCNLARTHQFSCLLSACIHDQYADACCVMCAQGLWHPARKVRQVYWKIYNNLYIGAQDALVSCYPRLEDDGHNTFHRSELHTFI